MSQDNFNLIIIVPARKGSQRVPFKNRIIVQGNNLVERALIDGEEISSILGCKYKLILTTNDEYFLDKTNNFKNLIKVNRPSELSNNSSRMVDVVSHTLNKYGDNKSLVILLQPSTPFRDPKEIAKKINQFVDYKKNKPLTIVATRKCKEKPLHIYKSLDNKLLMPLLPNLFGRSLNTQEMDDHFVLTGGLYVFWRKFFLEKKKIIHGEIYNYEVFGKFSLDIDTKNDLEKLKLYELNPES